MKLSDFCLLKEDDDTYTVSHPKGHSFQVKKKGMGQKAQELVSRLRKEQHFESGGQVQGEEIPYERLFGEQAQESQAYGTPTPTPAPNLSETVATVPAQAALPVATPPVPGESVPIATSPEFAMNPAPVTAPQPQQAKPVGALPDIGQALQTERAALTKGAEAEALQGKATAQAEAQFAQQLKQLPTPRQTWQAHQDRDQELQTAVTNGNIDPNRYYSNMGTGAKISAGIAMILGGMGSGFTGKNVAVDLMQNAVDRDIEAQKADQTKNMNLWKMNRENARTEMEANLATENQMMAIVKAKMMMAAANAQGPVAQARIAPLIAQIDQQMATNNWKKSLIDQQSMGGMTKADPAQLVPFLVSPDQQKAVYGEIGAAQNTRRMGNDILKYFDEASKDNTVMRTGAGFLREPASVKGLHQAMMPTFSDLEGSTAEGKIKKTFENITPQPGDAQSTIDKKREFLREYLRSKASAPTAKGHGIDLSRFESTAPAEGPAQIQYRQGVPYQKVHGGWMPVKKGGG